MIKTGSTSPQLLTGFFLTIGLWPPSLKSLYFRQRAVINPLGCKTSLRLLPVLQLRRIFLNLEPSFWTIILQSLEVGGGGGDPSFNKHQIAKTRGLITLASVPSCRSSTSSSQCQHSTAFSVRRVQTFPSSRVLTPTAVVLNEVLPAH